MPVVGVCSRAGAAVRPRILQLRGASDSAFAHDIAIRNLRFLHSAPTFMADYEMPSGGDWSIHRGGAVFLDGTEDVSIDAVDIDKAGGNGIFLSNHAWRTTISGSTISHAGDSGIVLVGSTRLMNGTANTYPAYTNITGNLVFENGFYGKQTASYFKSISYGENFDISMTHHLAHFLRISQLHPTHPHTPRVAVTSPWCPC